MPSPNPSIWSLPNAAPKGQSPQQLTVPQSEPSPFPLMVVAQHGKDPTQPTLHSNLVLQCNANVLPFIDFPGEGEDEIAFQKGEIIVVIAKDEGFGDGWWTVTTLLILLPPFHFVLFLSLSSFAFSCALAAFHLGGWLAGGRSTRYAQLRYFALHMHRSCGACLWEEIFPRPESLISISL